MAVLHEIVQINYKTLHEELTEQEVDMIMKREIPGRIQKLFNETEDDFSYHVEESNSGVIISEFDDWKNSK